MSGAFLDAGLLLEFVSAEQEMWGPELDFLLLLQSPLARRRYVSNRQRVQRGSAKINWGGPLLCPDVSRSFKALKRRCPNAKAT